MYILYQYRPAACICFTTEQSCKGLQIYCIKYGQISMVVEQT